MRRVFILAIGLAMGLGVQALPASAVSLSDLVQNNGSIEVGDKLFNNFSTDIEFGELDVTVDPITLGGEPGLRFSSSGTLDPEELVQGRISYDASIPTGTFLIHDFTAGITAEPLESVGFLDGITLAYVGIGSPIEYSVGYFRTP